MSELRTNQVFLSYASEDLEQVRNVYEGLKKRNLQVWFDKVDFKLGQRFKPQLQKAINQSRYFVICLSEAALRKTGDEPGFQDHELNVAWEIAREHPEKVFSIVPVRLEDCNRGDHRLDGWQQCDLFPDFEKGLDKVAIDLDGISLADDQAQDKRSNEQKFINHLIAKANIEYFTRNFDNAISIYKAIQVIKPDYYPACSNQGEALLELERYDEAVAAYDKAIELNPDHYVILNNKGVALAMLHRDKEAKETYQKALEACERALEIRPNDERTLKLKKLILKELK